MNNQIEDLKLQNLFLKNFKYYFSFDQNQSLNLLCSCNFSIFNVNDLLNDFKNFSFVQKEIMIFLVKNQILSEREFVFNFFTNLLMTESEKGSQNK